MGTEILSHLFLDVFNAYGIGWLEPFSHYRYSFNTLFVADPFFSIWPGLAALILLVVHRHRSARIKWSRFGLIFCSLYFLYALAHKFKIDNDARYAMLHQHIHYSDYFTTPAPFNNWLWFVVAKTDSGYYCGYRSVFDKTDSIDFHFFPRNDSLLKSIPTREDLGQLLRFSQEYYTVVNSGNGIVFNVLRFGQMQGWQNPAAPFVFHYYLQDPDANHMVVQRGRFAGWNRQSIEVYLRRIRGRG